MAKITQKEKKAIDVAREWIKIHCKKGEKLEVTYSSNAFVLTKVNPVYFQEWTYKLNNDKIKLAPKKRK